MIAPCLFLLSVERHIAQVSCSIWKLCLRNYWTKRLQLIISHHYMLKKWFSTENKQTSTSIVLEKKIKTVPLTFRARVSNKISVKRKCLFDEVSAKPWKCSYFAVQLEENHKLPGWSSVLTISWYHRLLFSMNWMFHAPKLFPGPFLGPENQFNLSCTMISPLNPFVRRNILRRGSGLLSNVTWTCSEFFSYRENRHRANRLI